MVHTGELTLTRPTSDRGAAPTIEQLVAEYQDRLLNFVARMLGNREDAEEVVQDTFAKADRALRRATPDRPIDPTAAWFYTIALNTTRNRLRRHRLATVAVEQAENLSDPAGRPDYGDPAELTGQQETRRQIEAALKRLPAHQRAPVILRFVEELSYEEIAAVLGCPVGTAKSHVHRGTRRLRRELAETGGKE